MSPARVICMHEYVRDARLAAEQLWRETEDDLARIDELVADNVRYRAARERMRRRLGCDFSARERAREAPVP